MDNREYIVAIDLGSGYITATVAHRTTQGEIAIDYVATQPSHGIVRGEVKNMEQAAQAIREVVAKVEAEIGIKIKEAFAGISGDHLKYARQPYFVYVDSADGEIFDRDVDRLNQSMESIKAPEGFSLLEIIPQHYLIDGEGEVSDPVGRFGNTLSSIFYLIMGDKTIISRHEKVLQRAGVKPKGMFVNPIATTMAVTYLNEREMGVVVVDLGLGTTDIAIYKDGIIRHIGVVPMGAELIDRDIRSFGITEGQVERVKREFGSAMPGKAKDTNLVMPGRTASESKEVSLRTVAAIIEARLMDIAEHVVDEIRLSGYEDGLDAGMILTGGSAQLNDIADFFEKKTKLRVRIAPGDAVVDDESMDRVKDTGYATSVGLVKLGADGTDSTAVEHTAPARETKEELSGERLEQNDTEKVDDKNQREKRTRGRGLMGMIKKGLGWDALDDEEDDDL